MTSTSSFTAPADFVNAYVLGNVGCTGAIAGACASFLYNLRLAVEDIQSGRRRLVVVGNAVTRTNPEAQAVEALGIEKTSFPAALGRFFLGEVGRSLVVAGTHGKTTTTGMLDDARLPIDAGELRPDLVVFDAIVKPDRTPLLAAAAALPALAAIYILRNRYRRREVSSLMLWEFAVLSREGGAKVNKLQLPLVFFLELIALALLVTAATGPRWQLPAHARPFVVILGSPHASIWTSAST